MNATIRKTALVTSLIWLGMIVSCGTMETIKTWIIVDDGLRHHTVKEDEMITFLQGMGYRCYSPEDDTAWRTEFATYKNCCEEQGHGPIP